MAVKSKSDLVFRAHKTPQAQSELHKGDSHGISTTTSGTNMENPGSSDQKSNPGDFSNSSMAGEHRLLDWDELR